MLVVSASACFRCVFNAFANFNGTETDCLDVLFENVIQDSEPTGWTYTAGIARSYRI